MLALNVERACSSMTEKDVVAVEESGLVDRGSMMLLADSVPKVLPKVSSSSKVVVLEWGWRERKLISWYLRPKFECCRRPY
jgi:hypothetical protein